MRLFTSVIYEFFKPSLMFVGKARNLPHRTTPVKMFHLGRLRPYSQTFRLRSKSLPWTNTLAYYEYSKITDRNSFITLGPGPHVLKLFTDIVLKFSRQATIFVPFRPLSPV